jgi:FRG domain
MNKHVYTVETLGGFSSAVETTTKSWSDDSRETPWFRGQRRNAWKLRPSIFRAGSFSKDDEDEMREEFVLRSPALTHDEVIPQDDWSAYFMMQHYGAPTRLLDWTESPLLALYFALKENFGYYDAAVWMLEPHALNEIALGDGSVIAPSAFGVEDKDKNLLRPWLNTRFDKKVKLPSLPVAIYPTHFARRISSQRSCFTIHGSRPDAFDSFLRRRKCLGKIVIPAHAVREMKSSLALHGIDETMIFPDLAGLCKVLSERWCVRQESKPHADTFMRLRPSKAKAGDVGIFAIRPIKRNAKIFTGENEEITWTSAKDIPKSGQIKKLYEDFGIGKSDRLGTPTSFNRLTPAWYMQDSKKPNVRCDDDYDFYALRNIRQGEELTVDYSTFHSPITKIATPK